MDPMDAVLGAFDARDPGRDQAVMLEEVQMPPSELLEVSGFAKLLARGAGIHGPAFNLDVEAQLGWLLLDIEHLALDFPGVGEPEA